MRRAGLPRGSSHEELCSEIEKIRLYGIHRNCIVSSIKSDLYLQQLRKPTSELARLVPPSADRWADDHPWAEPFVLLKRPVPKHRRLE